MIKLLSFSLLLLVVGCGGNAGSHIYIDICDADPFDPVCLNVDGGIGGTGGFAGNGGTGGLAGYGGQGGFGGFAGTGGTGGVAGGGGTGGIGGTSGMGGGAGFGGVGGVGGAVEECRCNRDCLDGNKCTWDVCKHGVCKHYPVGPAPGWCEANHEE